MHSEPIAIIGMGCRFPGSINDVESYWNFLCTGGDAVVEIPKDRWNIDRFYDPEPGILGKSIAKWGGFIDGIDQFDPQFFGISPREAPYIDPQQRLLLETAWEAMEMAGIKLDLEDGTDIGVYAGVSHTDYQNIQGNANDRAAISPHSPTGNAHSIGANRISYCFNLLGPSIALDTACSSALTAVHLACEQLEAGRCKMALAGGVTVMITPDGFIGFSQAGMLSPDGRCKAFDASANGFVRGEGAGMVLLKPLATALADGDPVYAVIRGSAANQDGHTNGISLPGEDAQARLVADACKDAGIDPSSIGYVEAHGTGTAVGDPIEAHALARALCTGRDAAKPLPMGSVKSNLGHLETAAGIASLIKAALIVQRGQIPPSIHFENPNPNINFEECKLRVPTAVEAFPNHEGPRLVGVNSFGFGGANAHVILSEAPHVESAEKVSIPDRAWPIVLSARSEESLEATARAMADWIETHDKSNGSSPLLPELVYSLGVRHNHHQYRLTVVAESVAQLVEDLRSVGTEEVSPNVRSEFTPAPENPLRVGFVMSGQGPQWWGMGRELMKAEPVFREAMEQCAVAIDKHANFKLLEELGRDEDSTRLQETEIGQPAIFAMQYSLSQLWKAWGVEPEAIAGHSVGEIAAACVAGILSVEEASRVIVLRSQVMNECARGEGTMLAVSVSQDEAGELIARHDSDNVSIAAFNGPRSLTLSGPKASLEKIQEELDAKEVFARFVRVDHPFHHAMMQPAADAMDKALADLVPGEESVPFYSTVTGKRHSGVDCKAAHWAAGIRQPVQFVAAVDSLADHGVDVWLEISAHPALAMAINECLGARDVKAPVISSARREREHGSALDAALSLHREGVVLDFSGMTPSRHQLQLPAYAWNKERWWHEAAELRDGRLADGGKGLLDMRLPRAAPTWITRLDERHMSFLRDHQVDTHIVFPAAAFADMALEAGVEIFDGRPFAIEDFEIRKPLIMADPPVGLILEFSYDPGERTFSIQSRFEPSETWSQHVVGSMRAERVESSFMESDWQAPGVGQDAIDSVDFYDYMTAKGLNYGPEFRAADQLHAGGGESSGVVSLTPSAGERAGEYALHPVLLDAALHVFSAGARTVEGRRAGMKLPVRFGRILYVQSPGASSKVSARVLQCNEELIEGRIGLYNEAGEPCVLVDGFRAVSMNSVRKAGSSGGTRDLVYHVDWERSKMEKVRCDVMPVPLEELHVAAKSALDEVLEMRGQSRLEAVMVAEDELTCAQIAGGLREMGVDFTGAGAFSADSLNVAESMRLVFRRLMDKMAARDLILTESDGWKATRALGELAEREPEVRREFFTKNPGNLPEGMLCIATGEAFGPIMRGEEDAVQTLFGGANADLLEHFYGDGLFASHWMTGIAGAVKKSAQNLPEGRGLRILEVGAGTGGLAAYILPQLERDLHSYTFSDVSAGFFSAAAQKLSLFDSEIEYKVYNLEKSPEDQDFELGSFDFIVGTNVLHAVADVKQTLSSLHDLLAPGGTLAFMDVATPQLWAEAVFGLTSGWWSFTDRELRPEQPLLSRDQWTGLLDEVGFSEVASLPGMASPEGGEGQIGLLAQKPWAIPSSIAPDLPELDEECWVLFADSDGLGESLAGLVRKAGGRCRVVTRGDSFKEEADQIVIRADDADDWKQLSAGWQGDDAPERFVYLWSSEGSMDDVMDGITSLLNFAHVLGELPPSRSRSVVLVTRGAQPVGRDGAAVAIAQAPSIGLFRVMLSENPGVACRSIDLSAGETSHDAMALFEEILEKEAEREVALRGEARFVQRLSRGLPVTNKTLPADVPLRLESRERGILDSLRFSPFVEEKPAAGEVLIQVKAAGMNFRDVLKALALYPAETADARMFGDEVGGVVVAVGEGVEHLAVGDDVYGLAVFGIATHSLARAADVVKLPEGISYEEAATIPVVFMTAWHALNQAARVRSGEWILVHAGAGGVGMAAIQIAHHLGAKVIASAGSPAKRDLLKTLGVAEVIDSRRGDFAERVMELTDRRGVDVVLNALASEAIPMGLSCLAEYGRFIEIGKRDIYQNSRLPLWSLRKNASFHVVAMDAVFAGGEELTRELLGEINDLLKQRALTPLPYRTFPASRVDAAFRLMAGGKHTGKVVISFADPFVVRSGNIPRPAFDVNPKATYLITGGLGGFGKVLSNWLVDAGARHLTLTGRRGLETPGAPELVEQFKNMGVEVNIEAADISSEKDVAKVFANLDRPLKGVFHLAMVIDDAPLADLTAARFESVVAPKAIGAWLLHQQTEKLDLDCFVMFSSISSVFGNPAQGNYSAANALLDSLGHYRHAKGLPALTVNWGALGGEGYVARNEKVAEFLSRQGTHPIEPAEVTALLETFIDANIPQACAIRVDWAKWRQTMRGIGENPLLERIFAGGVEADDSGSGAGDWRGKIDDAAPEERLAVIVLAVQDVVGSVLRVKPDTLREDQPLTDLGLDSLMGVEIENLIESSIGVTLPPTSLMRARTIGQIAVLISGHIGGETVTDAAPAAVEGEAIEASEIDLDSISDHDLDRLLEDDETMAGTSS